jgi:hypothetical protein
MTDISNGTENIYWIITDGSLYGTGVTEPGQTTSVGNGWTLWWSGTDRAEYESKCSEAGIESVPEPPID